MTKAEGCNRWNYGHETRMYYIDEPTAMLDPDGRKEVISTIRELNKKEKVTILLITHHMDEVTSADKVIVMNQGRLLCKENPEKYFLKWMK